MHAQILVGDGDKVRALAHKIAKGINCLNPSKQENPCDKCISCKVFESNNHPDTFYVKKTKQSSIGVDDVREQITQPMATKPIGYKYKVFIIDKAETLTPAAQSALLKIIEEPAPYGVFLFLAPNPHGFLPTILSRCHLRKVQGETSQSTDLKTLAEEIAATAHAFDLLEAFAAYKKFEPYKDSKETLLEILDLLYRAYGEKITASSNPQDQWLGAISAITHAKNILSQNGNIQLAIELMFANIAQNKLGPSPI